MTNLKELIEQGEAPEHLTESGYKTLLNGYLLPGETPKGMYTRLAKTVSSYLNKPELEEKFFDFMNKGWLCPSTPISSNCGTKRGLPISCFGSNISDSMQSILDKAKEVGILSKLGGGTAGYFGNLRPSGSPITGGGTTDGPVPFMKIFDSIVSTTNQGATRRGSFAAYLDIEHNDAKDFLRIRRPEGDINRQCLNIHHGICITDNFLTKVINGSEKETQLFKEVLKTRIETGEPYIFFTDNVNNQAPQVYKDKQLKITHSQLCSEVKLNTDELHTFVCCLLSLNVAKWHEWKDTDLPYWSIWFLDGIISEFIEKAEGIKGIESALRFAKRERALGLGVLGFHTLLQKEMVGFDSFRAKILNKAIFKTIREQADRATRDLAKEYGEPELLKGYGIRNSTLLAVAPTASNSIISGNVSAGIEPINANVYEKATAKGSFIEYNPQLKELLLSKGLDTPEIWKQILKDSGSVRNINGLIDEEKNVFKTAFEIDQRYLIDLAADRQVYIDQGQSLNLFFNADIDPQFFYEVHIRAWQKGLKSLYYVRSSSVLKADLASRECQACEA